MYTHTYIKNIYNGYMCMRVCCGVACVTYTRACI